MKRSSRFVTAVIAAGLSLLSLPALAGDGHRGGHGGYYGPPQGWGPPGHAHGWHKKHWGGPAYVYAPRYYYAAPRYYAVPHYYSAPAYYPAPAAYDVSPQVSLSFSLSAPLH